MNNQQKAGKETLHNLIQNRWVSTWGTTEKPSTKRNSDTDNLLNSICSEDFETLGIIAYHHGLDFVNILSAADNKSANSIVANIYERVLGLGITRTELTAFYDIISKPEYKIDNDFVQKKYSDKLLETVKVSDIDDLNKIKKQLYTLFNDTLIPVSMIDSLKPITDKFTNHSSQQAGLFNYHELLQLNSIIYDDTVTIGNSAYKALINIQSSKLWKELLNEASVRFEEQKFGVVFYDMILSIRELIHSQPAMNALLLCDMETFDWGNWSKNIFESKSVDVVEEITQQKVEKEIPENIKNGNISGSILGFLQEATKTELNHPIDLIKGFLEVLNNPDHSENVGNIYEAMARATTTDKRIPSGIDSVQSEHAATSFKYVYGFEREKFFQSLEAEIQTTGLEYKNVMELFVSEITPINKSLIIGSINNMITYGLHAKHAGVKMYLINQLAENSIHTFKQLYQTIEVIEQCTINLAGFKYYAELKQHMKAFDETFKIIDKIQPTETEMKFLTMIKKFYKAMMD